VKHIVRSIVAVVAVVSSAAACESPQNGSAPPVLGPPRAGQIVFIPWETGATVGAPPALEPSSIDLESCELTPNGLRVEGHVVPPTHSAVVVVAVSGHELDLPGVRVGFNNLADQGVPGANPGDFRLTLPWADERSRFAVVGKVGDRQEPAQDDPEGQPCPGLLP
jgi:hypothetical protein